MSSRRVLVADGETGTSRDAVAVVRGLAAEGFRPVMAVSSPGRRLPLSRYVDHVMAVPAVSHHLFPEALKEAGDRSGSVGLIIASEPVLLAVGTTVPQLLTKRGLADAADRAGLGSPSSQVFTSSDELRDGADGLEFPVVVKPSVRTSLAIRIDDPGQLQTAQLPNGALMVQPFISGPFVCVNGVMWNGRLHAASHERWIRIWPLDCGLAAMAVTIECDPALEAGLERLMGRYDGIFSAQFIGGKIIDLNLRSCSTAELARAAGVNIAATYARLVRGECVPESRSIPGVRYRWISGDMRALKTSVATRRLGIAQALREWAPKAGTVHPLMRVNDPKPLLARLMSRSSKGLT